MNNIQNTQVLAINCSIENGDIIAGLIVVAARTSSPQLIVDLDSGLKYSVQLPEELEYQGMVTSLDDVRMPITGFD